VGRGTTIKAGVQPQCDSYRAGKRAGKAYRPLPKIFRNRWILFGIGVRTALAV
jgi:hypothetical protein